MTSTSTAIKIKQASDIFAVNSLICQERGLSVQDCANITKKMFIGTFGWSCDVAEAVISK